MRSQDKRVEAATARTGLREDLEVLEVAGQLEEAVVGVGHRDVDAGQPSSEDGCHTGEQRRLPQREPVLPRHRVLHSSHLQSLIGLAVWSKA
jgi:hypothetical protein